MTLSSSKKSLLCSAIISISLAVLCNAQTATPQAGSPKINLESVKKTVSFLASDEMAGRDTPSPELAKAADYVASRFEKAGLKGLGDEGSFHQTTEIATVSVPQTGIVVRQNQNAIEHLGLLSADSKPFSYQGKIITLPSGKSPNPKAKYDGPVSLVAGPFKTRREQSNFFRRLSRLRNNGATAILVQVDDDHALRGQAERASRPTIVNRQGRATGPVVLIPKMDLEGEFELEFPARINDKAKVSNVMGVLRGSDPKLTNEAIIFTAHLDHIGQQGLVGDTIYNGADDDASGVTAVLTLADAFADRADRPKRSLIFMTFWGEEKGLLGSRYYANNPTWPLEKTVANINIEMIGRPEPGSHEKCWMTGWEHSDLGKMMNDGASQAGVLIFEHPKYSGFLYRASDNYSLVEKGVIAHSFSAGSLHDDYHQPTDEWQRLDLKHMTRVIEGLFAASIPLADGKVTPQKIQRPKRRTR